MKPFYTTVEAADLVGLASETLRKRAASGKIPAQRIGRDWVLSAETVEAERQRVAAKPHKKATDTRANKTAVVTEAAAAAGWAYLPKKQPQTGVTARRYETVADVEKAAQKGKIKALVLDADGNVKGEMKWQNRN
jgi:excisionase family DNA binding protein